MWQWNALTECSGASPPILGIVAMKRRYRTELVQVGTAALSHNLRVLEREKEYP
jgi:hypothetical protein